MGTPEIPQPQEFKRDREPDTRRGSGAGGGDDFTRPGNGGSDDGGDEGVDRWEKRVELWQSALDGLTDKLRDRTDKASHHTSTKVERLKAQLAMVSHHIDRIRESPASDAQRIHRELEAAWRRFLDAFAEASQQAN